MSSLAIAVLQIGGIFTGLINIYIWVLIISALLSFVNPDPYNPIVQFLNRLTMPAYAFVRRFMRTDFNGLDLAPLVLIVALQVLEVFVKYIFGVIATSL